MTIAPRAAHETIAALTAPSSPFEISEWDLDGARYRAYAHAATTLPQLLSAVRAHGNRDFLIFDGQRTSFEEFVHDVDALAAALQLEFGVRRGDRVAIAMRNCPDWMMVFVAATFIGAVVVPVNSWGSAEELEYTINDCGATLLAADSTRARLAADFVDHTSIDILFSDVESAFDDLPAAVAATLRIHRIDDVVTAHRGHQYEAAAPDPGDVALLMYTSGSTGRPKGVIIRHVAIGQAMMNMVFLGAVVVRLGDGTEPRATATGEAQLVTVPLFHATGLLSGFLLPCVVGHKVALMRKWDAEIAMDIIATEKITTITSVPAIVKDLLTHPKLGDHDLSSITRVAAGGAATPADMPDLLRDKLGIVSRSAGYGMTETTAVGAAMTGPLAELKPLSSGIPSPIIECRAADGTGAILDSGLDGEIQLRGITVTPGYWQRDDVTAEAFTADGWLRTGDIGHLDDDGFLHITGRIKDIVIRGGENIAPNEIENAAYRHPAVKEAAVFGVPDDMMGEELAMVWQPRPGAELTEDEMRRHLHQLLPKFKVPKYITLSPEALPRNVSEKIDRRRLQRECSTNQTRPTTD